MKKLVISILSLVFLALSAWAQTAEEIVRRMDEVFDAREKDGMEMTMDLKIPLLGTSSVTTYTLGDKMRLETTMLGITVVQWSDGTTKWDYDRNKNEVVITPDDGSLKKEGGDEDMFNDATEGYDVSIKKETADAWYILCKKNKSNQDKDAPKTFDLVIAKDTYQPVSLSAKMHGITMTIRDIRFGVSEKTVTFNIGDYPNVKVTDKR